MTARVAIPLFGAFALLALYETAQAIYAPLAVATDEDWAAAAGAVRTAHQPRDLIVFAPSWADQVGRRHLGDLCTPEMAGRADDARYERVWELSIRGADAPEASGRILAASQHGRVRVRLYEKAPAVEIGYDFTARLEEARVTQVPTDGHGDETPCFIDGAGFRCTSTRVERRTLEVDYSPRRGILTPVDGALTTRIEFPAVTLGSTLVGWTALHDYFSRKNSDGPVDFALFIDGQQVHSVHHENSDGWRKFTVPVTQPGGPHAIRFEIRAPSAAWRTFGFHVEARR
ncbi:MAG: hypothetical protein EXR72_13710 [Myxococcales bacterium]|nr:hypothetical protein [Myxococcales bacterium]